MFVSKKDEPDIEMPRTSSKGFVKIDIDMAKLSSHASLVNTTILDNVVKKFSVVSGHQVRGKWRTALSISVVAVPIVVFAVMLWYQVYVACTANCQYYPLINTVSNSGISYSTESTIRSFLAQDSIHYCSSALSHVVLTNDDVGAGTDWYPCTITNHQFSDSGTCVGYKDLSKVMKEIGSFNCFDASDESMGNLAIFYTQCTPIQTALVNSIQVAMYSIVATICLYLALRVLAKHGVCGLFSAGKWVETLQNEKAEEEWRGSEAVAAERA